mgnify:CR=1 FL=1
MIETVLQQAAGKNVVLVVEGGGAVCLKAYKDDNRVSSILFIGYPGQSGGTGLADILFGHYSPSGRLTQTFYASDFIDEVSFLDYNMRATMEGTGASTPGRGYRFYKGNSVVYPFGFGLSYTTFIYLWHDKCLSQTVSSVVDFKVSLSVNITNIGGYPEYEATFNKEAAESILVYVIPPADVSAQDPSTPMRVLRQFEKVSLAPMLLTLHLTSLILL